MRESMAGHRPAKTGAGLQTPDHRTGRTRADAHRISTSGVQDDYCVRGA